ncbi:MAG: hypothetical protein PUP91_09030 [Rhizonema sp. PD37]|nr:hypothetical protein [Rhizonema sp. PD37]
MTQQLTDEEIIKKQERLLELEPDCSTGRLGTPEEQKQKIDALLARAKARKQKANG